MKTFSFFRKALCCLFVLGIAFSSCSDDDTKYDKEINDINKEIQSLKDQLANLSKNAYIADVKPLADGSGFTVVKSDGKEETIKVKGEKGEQGEAGKPGTASTVTIGADGFWYIDGKKTDQKAQGEPGQKVEVKGGILYIDGKAQTLAGGTVGANSLLLVDAHADYYEFIQTDAAGKATTYRVGKATHVVTSLELVPTDVSATNVKGIYFPIIAKDVFQKNPVLVAGNAWDYNNSIALVGYPYSIAYSGTATAKYRVNPASVSVDAFEVIGFAHEKATVRAITASEDFTILKQEFSEGLLTLNIAGKNIANHDANKQSMISLFVQNKKDASAKEGEESMVFSEYVPAISDKYDADLVRRLTDADKDKDGKYPLATFLGETYHVLHPKMHKDGTKVYKPLSDLPATSAPAGSTEQQKKDAYDLFLKAIKEVRNFTYVFDNSKPLVLADHLDGIWDAVGASPIASKYFKDSNFGYKLKFTPVAFAREGIEDQTKQYITVDGTTGKIAVVKPTEANAGDKNFAAIDRIAVVGVTMVDANGTEMMSRTIVIHIVSEEKEQPKEIEIRVKDQSVTLPTCNTLGVYPLDVDQIYNHKDVAKSKDDFNKQYTKFTPNLSTALQGKITLTDDCQASNSIGISGIENLEVGKYEIAGIFTGSGVTTVNVIWEFEIKHIVLNPVVKELYVSNWQTNTVIATGRDLYPLGSDATKPWDEITVLKNSFKRYYRNAVNGGIDGIEILDQDGKVCKVATVELGFILIDKATGKPWSSAAKGAHATDTYNSRYVNYGIKHELDNQQGVINNPAQWSSAQVYNRFVDLRLDWTLQGRSYVNRNNVAVQAVAYVDGDYSYYIPINMVENEGDAKSVLAQFDVKFNNPVQPIVGKDGKAVAGDVYLVDKKDAHKADLGKLFSIKDFRGEFVYENAKFFGAGTTYKDKWNMDKVMKYLVGVQKPVNNIASFPANGEPEVIYELYGESAKSEALRDKLTLTKDGIVTWVNKGEDLQKDLVVEFQITVRNQWNLGEYAANKDHNDVAVNTLKEIQTVVKVPLVTLGNGINLPVVTNP